MPEHQPSTRHIAVVGAGPGGLMAAEILAEAGASVTVYDRMGSPGRKLMLAGRGGLNLTHSEPLDTFLDRYGPDRALLAPAVEEFSPDDLRAWATGLGVETFVGSSGRVFPTGLRTAPLLRAWLARLDRLGVAFRLRHTWQGWTEDPGGLAFVDRSGTRVLCRPDATVLALGGGSWARTGSDAAWVGPLRAAGVEVTPLRPANCGFTVAWSSHFASTFAGSPLKNVALSHGGRTVRGEAMPTAAGIEGGAVYALSRALRETVDRTGAATLTIDLKPDVGVDRIEERLARRRPRDSASTGLRRAVGLSPVAIGLLREVAGSSLPVEPGVLARLVKHAPLTLTGTQPIDRAISTAGGIARSEVDAQFMLRRRPGTFVAGEMLDWEAPTGGYLLQATFATAVAAARGALARLADTGDGGSLSP